MSSLNDTESLFLNYCHKKFLALKSNEINMLEYSNSINSYFDCLADNNLNTPNMYKILYDFSKKIFI